MVHLLCKKCYIVFALSFNLFSELNHHTTICLDLDFTDPVIKDVVKLTNLLKEEEFLLKRPLSSVVCKVSRTVQKTYTMLLEH